MFAGMNGFFLAQIPKSKTMIRVKGLGRRIDWVLL